MKKRALELFTAPERGVFVAPIITHLPTGVGGHVAGSGFNGLGLQDGHERASEPLSRPREAPPWGAPSPP